MKGTIHWVSAAHAVEAEARLYERLFSAPDPEDTREEAGFVTALNPDSLAVSRCLLEPGLKGVEPGSRYQFERLGYFCVDTRDSTSEKTVFNRTITLRDSWAKIEKRNA